ncbi:MAG: MobF family relaxase [Chitinivibrionales bacterium]|nr:MobF family relaxase [Chitinivibrionales bacterium]
MISVSLSKSAESGSLYFDKDSYYSGDERTSQWYGRGATHLGVSGAVKKEEFDIIIHGFDLDKKALVNNAVTEDKKNEKGEVIKAGRSGYIDVTFSVPKSVSLMSYVDERIEQAHNKAVERAINEIENNYTFTRKIVDGELQSVQEDNVVIARINHYESRELDPQLHSHLVLMNLTQGDDEKWRSRDNGKVYQNQLYLGQLYRNELSAELQRIGYQIDVTDRAKGLYEIKGISREIIEDFSTRRKQIKEAEKEFKDYSCSESRKKEYACLSSRRQKTDSKIEEIREKTDNKLTQNYGKTLEQLKEESLRLERPAGPAVSQKEALEIALEEVTDKQSGFRREEVLTHAMKATLGQCKVDELSGAFDKNEEIWTLGDKPRFALHSKSSDRIYTTKDILETEKDIMEWARDGRGTSEIAVAGDLVKNHLEALQEDKKLTKGQQEAVEMVCTTKDRLSLVQGDAGAGKSYACDHIRQIMKGITVRGFAPTGKAADELSGVGIETRTVDSFLESAKMGRTGVGKREVWLVDEAGMMGSRKLEKFLKEAEKYEAKVVLIGDRKQFLSVEQGKIFADLQEHAGVSKAELTEVKRQETKHAKEIVKAIKERDFDKAFSTLEGQGAFKEIKNREERNSRIVDEYMSDRKNGIFTIVLTSTNADRNDINGEIRGRLTKEGSVELGRGYQTFQKADLNAVSRNFASSYKEGQVVVFKSDCHNIKRGTQATIVAKDTEKNTLSVRYYDREAKSYKESALDCLRQSSPMQVYDVVEKKFGAGDRVMFLKNDKNAGVKNGQTGTIKNIDEQGNAVIGIGEQRKKNYREVLLNLNNKGSENFTAYNYCDHAYCITSHKSQGSTYDKCIAAYDVSNHRTNFNEFYVAATRQKQDVTIYTNDKERFREQAELEQEKPSTFDMYDFSKYDAIMRQNRKQLEPEEKIREIHRIEQGLDASMERGGTEEQEQPKENPLKQKENVREIEHEMDL